MRLFLFTTLVITAAAAVTVIEIRDAHAVVYCSAVGVPRGCIVRPVVAAPVVVVAPVAPTVVYCKTVGVPKGCVVRR